jgi:lipid A 3-O-deacylase
MATRGIFLAGLLLFSTIFPEQIRAEKQGAVITLTEENDLFVRTDRHYTQGLKYTQMFEDDFVPRPFVRFADLVTPLGLNIQTYKAGFTLGQSMFTPANIDIAAPIPNDRPYGGWLYVGFILQRRGYTPKQRAVVENFELDLGVVGPEALGEEAQTKVHKIRGFNLPQGWDNQLATEPGIAFKYTRMYLFRAGDDQKAIDLIPHWGGSLGNVSTFVNAGATLRVGWHAPQDFGVATIDAPTVQSGAARHNWGAYLFTGIDGRLVGYNIFLDGNTWQTSQHVDAIPWVADIKFGAAIILKRVELSYTFVVRTKEFRTQNEHDEFGSLSMRYRF